MKNIIVSTLFIFISYQVAAAEIVAKGLSLSDDSLMGYKANLSAQTEYEKTEAQKMVDRIYDLGGRHVLLLPKARMDGPKSNVLVDMTPDSYKPKRFSDYSNLIKYIHSKGMTVGIRPIFFVYCMNDRGEVTFPCDQVIDGVSKRWWHGNIQPENPYLWFESFYNFLKTYMTIAKINKVEEFTIGAELYSLTVGIEDQWKEHPHGFPCEWVKIQKAAKKALPNARIMYDLTFTDDSAIGTDSGQLGGELERWRYRLVDLAASGDVNQIPYCQGTAEDGKPNSIWRAFLEFWKGLDYVGVDMYRSLASRNDVLPRSYSGLKSHLKKRTDQYAEQMNTALMEIQFATGIEKKIIFKEVGYKSKNYGFINSEEYDDGSHDVNIIHQQAAYEAFLESFWAPGWDWFSGVVFWDASTNPSRQGPMDAGFTPIRKEPTEEVIKKYFKESL